MGCDDMDRESALAAEFEQHRSRLRAVAYRMLGSRADAEDAVQEAWLRMQRTDTSDVESLAAWLTTVVARVSLNMLRARRNHPEELYAPEPIVDAADGVDPEHEALLADSVGLALLVVLETLTPAERLAFVLHDVFGLPFDEIAPIVDRSSAATRQLASRARRRVRDAAPPPDAGLTAQREVVEAFFAAARDGDFDRLVSVLDRDAILRVDAEALTVTGAETIAGRALMFSDAARTVRPVTINGAAGVLVLAAGRPFSLMAFTVVGGRVATIDVVLDPDRLATLDLPS